MYINVFALNTKETNNDEDDFVVVVDFDGNEVKSKHEPEGTNNMAHNLLNFT